MIKCICASKTHLNQSIYRWKRKCRHKEIKKQNKTNTFIDNSQTIDDVYENLDDYKLTKKRKVLKEFDGVIADMEANKKLSPFVTELMLTGRRVIISLVFISQSYCEASKTIRPNATHYFIMKIPNRRELQYIASNRSY